MSSLLFVLSPNATSTTSANEFPPFSCHTRLDEILRKVSEEIRRVHVQYGDSIVYEHYIVFDGLFYGMPPETVPDGVRTKLAQNVYAALLDCRMFDNFTSTINTLWALLSFIRGDSRDINEEKTIYIINHKNAPKYQNYLAVHTKIVSDQTDLGMYLVDKLRDINKAYSKLSEQHPRT